mmetsp:Transcript_14201/g.32198  ORF Transcript_14201/g.32198 Transcript_14201/m.32198 type:complete len:247 (-) Transcript_14201:769-1509(-)
MGLASISASSRLSMAACASSTSSLPNSSSSLPELNTGASSTRGSSSSSSSSSSLSSEGSDAVCCCGDQSVLAPTTPLLFSAIAAFACNLAAANARARSLRESSSGAPRVVAAGPHCLANSPKNSFLISANTLHGRVTVSKALSFASISFKRISWSNSVAFNWATSYCPVICCLAPTMLLLAMSVLPAGEGTCVASCLVTATTSRRLDLTACFQVFCSRRSFRNLSCSASCFSTGSITSSFNRRCKR